MAWWNKFEKAKRRKKMKSILCNLCRYKQIPSRWKGQKKKLWNSFQWRKTDSIAVKTDRRKIWNTLQLVVKYEKRKEGEDKNEKQRLLQRHTGAIVPLDGKTRVTDWQTKVATVAVPSPPHFFRFLPTPHSGFFLPFYFIIITNSSFKISQALDVISWFYDCEN